MRYSKGLVIYEDKLGLGTIPRLIILIVPVVLLISSYYLFRSGETQGGQVLLLEAFIVAGILLAVFPRAYRIYEDHIRIVLGGPFSLKVSLDSIKSVEVTGRQRFSVNFTSRVTGKYVAIILKKGMSIAITPRDNDQFVEYANQALREWEKTRA